MSAEAGTYAPNAESIRPTTEAGRRLLKWEREGNVPWDVAAEAIVQIEAEALAGTLDEAWAAAEAALPERLDERSLSFWFDTRKPSGWRAAASHRFVKGFDSPAAALLALAAALRAVPA